jgi:hypothetical protein
MLIKDADRVNGESTAPRRIIEKVPSPANALVTVYDFMVKVYTWNRMWPVSRE